MSPKCKYNKKKDQFSESFTGKIFGVENIRQAAITAKILKENPDSVKRVLIVWQCEFEAARKKDKKRFPKMPNTRLSITDTLRGGTCCYYNTFYSNTNNPNEDLHYIDVVSLYPYIMANSNFSCGTYKREVGAHLNDCISFKDGEMYLRNNKLFGLIQVTILPKYSDIPFLSIRRNNSQLVYTNCDACGRKGLQKKSCRHDEFSRALLGSWTVPEITYCVVKLGYTLIRVHEVMYWSKSLPFLSKYVKYFAKRKISHSKIELKPGETIQEYCADINQQMGFGGNGPISGLSPSDINENEYFRLTSKMVLNSLFGQLCIQHDDQKTEFLTNFEELEERYLKGDIIDIVSVQEKYCQVLVKGRKNPTNRRSHIITGKIIIT